MGKSIAVEAVEVPVTSSISILLVLVWAYLTHRGLGYAEVGFSYDSVIGRRQLWRLLTSVVSHVELLHLVFNISGLWSLKGAERLLGSGYYLHTSLLLVVTSDVLAVLLYCLLVKVAGREQYRGVTTVGYSGVLFGWMTIISVKNPGGMNRMSLLGLLHIPLALAPFGSLLLTSLLIPRASFVGHLSGIIMGYVIGFGGLDWVTPWWAVTGLAWMFIGLVYSAVNRYISVPFIELHGDADIESGLAPDTTPRINVVS